MMLYLFEVTFCWLIFLLLYRSLLQRETFFQINRWYLLVSLISGLALPLFNWDIPSSYVPEMISESIETVQLEYQSLTDDIAPFSEVRAAREKSVDSYLPWLFILYVVGVILSILRFMVGLIKIARIHLQSKGQIINGHQTRVSDRVIAPFAFINQIYIHPSYIDDKEINQIISHEAAHVSGKHSVDIILISLIKSLLWFHPLVYIYDRMLQLVHEYIADEYVLRKGNLLAYGNLLARQLHPRIKMVLAHHLFSTHLKHRFKMMTQTKSEKISIIKYFSVFPLAIFFMVLFSNQTVKRTITPTEMIHQFESRIGLDSTKLILDEKLSKWGLVSTYDYASVEQKPLLLSCPLDSEFKNLKCIESTLLKYIRSGSSFSAGLKQTTGATLNITLDKYGNAIKMTTLMSESFRISIFPSLDWDRENLFTDWQPAKEGNLSVPCNLTFQLKITRSKKSKFPFYSGVKSVEIIKSPSDIRDEFVFHSTVIDSATTKLFLADNISMTSKFHVNNDKMKVWRNRKSNQVGLHRTADIMPILKQFEPVAGPPKNREISSVEMLYKYIDKKIKFPKIAKQLDVSGQSWVEFTIDQEGRAGSATITRNNGAQCGEALKEVVDKFNAEHTWLPAQTDDKNKSVTISIPYNFKFNKYGGRKISNDGGSSLFFSNGTRITKEVNKKGKQTFYISALPLHSDCELLSSESKEYDQCNKTSILNFFNDVFHSDKDFQKLKSENKFEISYSRWGIEAIHGKIEFQ